MKQTAMQEHIEWLKATIEIAEEEYPILVNTLKLCLNNATHKLEMEKQQIIKAVDYFLASVKLSYDKTMFTATTAEQYYNITFKSE